MSDAGTVELSGATFGFESRSPFWQLLNATADSTKQKRLFFIVRFM